LTYRLTNAKPIVNRKKGVVAMISGEKVKKLRKKRGLSQFELAVKAFVTPITVVRIENEQHKPIAAIAKTIADALGVTVEELAGEGE
jgi:repressor LexA